MPSVRKFLLFDNQAANAAKKYVLRYMQSKNTLFDLKSQIFNVANK